MTATSASSPTILVVELDDSARALLSNTFQRAGFNTLLADSGEAAVNLYREAHSSVNLVLLSAQRPGLNGRRVLAALQEINPAVCCVIATGVTPQDEILPLVRQGAIGLLPKPLVLDNAVQFISEVVKGGRGASPHPRPGR
jgi:DNA-binding NtrC family response regulator